MPAEAISVDAEGRRIPALLLDVGAGGDLVAVSRTEHDGIEYGYGDLHWRGHGEEP